MTPLPPSLPTVKVFDVAPVAFGEVWCTFDGTDHVATQDGVRITVLGQDGTPSAIVLQTVESAMALATTIASAAGRAIDAQVGDDGKPLSQLERIAKLTVRP